MEKKHLFNDYHRAVKLAKIDKFSLFLNKLWLDINFQKGKRNKLNTKWFQISNEIEELQNEIIEIKNLYYVMNLKISNLSNLYNTFGIDILKINESTLNYISYSKKRILELEKENEILKKQIKL